MTEFVCNHEHVGTVSAGAIESGPFCSVATCHYCLPRAQRFVHARVGKPASQLLTYEDYRLRGRS